MYVSDLVRNHKDRLCRNADQISRVVRKTCFRICENKAADQVCSNCATDQRLYFHYIISKSLNFLNLKFQASGIFCGCAAWFVSDMFGKPEDRVSRGDGHSLALM